MPKLIKWHKGITFSRGPKDRKETQENVVVEVPQIDEDLNMNEFMQDLVNLCDGEKGAKEWINSQLANAAIGAGRSSFNASATKKDTTTVEQALADALKTIREYTPRGGRTGEGVTAKAKKMDFLAEAAAKYKSGQLSKEELETLLAQTLGL